MEIHEHPLSNNLQKMILQIIYKKWFLHIYNFSSLYLPPSANVAKTFPRRSNSKNIASLVKIGQGRNLQFDASKCQ